METCRAAVITEHNKPLTIERVPIPDLDPGSLLIKIAASTLCGTDVHRWHGPLSDGDSLPIITGHEPCGYVEDIAGGILLALDKGRIGETYVLSGPVTTMREAIETVASATGRKAPKRAMPVALMKALTPIGPLVGKMMGQPPNLRELISSADGVTFWASHEKASRELGYSPRGMDEGLRQTLAEDERFPAPVA